MDIDVASSPVIAGVEVKIGPLPDSGYMKVTTGASGDRVHTAAAWAEEK